MEMPPCVRSILDAKNLDDIEKILPIIARFYIDDGFLEEEILELIKTWFQQQGREYSEVDAILAITQARMMRQFNCAIFRGAKLKLFCIGKDLCQWAEARKNQYQSFVESKNWLAEEVWDGKNSFKFAVWNGKEVSYREYLDAEGRKILPVATQEITEGAVLLPTQASPYESTDSLLTEIKQHIHFYLDIPEQFETFTAWYILMSWIYDKLPTVSYLRFLGNTATGKSRALDTIGRLCYKATIVSGAITPAPIYRIIRKFRGTIILEEADFYNSSEKAEVIKILLSGFERGRPIIRCVKDNLSEIEILPCFGPKIFATRWRFQDVALETRCLTNTMKPTDRKDIPPVLTGSFYQREMALRNKLLSFRFQNRVKINDADIEKIDLGDIKMRLKQVYMPFVVPFAGNPKTVETFKSFLGDYNQKMIDEEKDTFTGKIVQTIFDIAETDGKNGITPTTISNILVEETQEKCTPERVGRVLKSLGLPVKVVKIGGKTKRVLIWNEAEMQRLYQNYQYPEKKDLQPKLQPQVSPQALPQSTVTEELDF